MERLYHNRVWLEGEHVFKRRTLADIASQCGVSKQVVSLYVQRFGLHKPARPVWMTFDADWLREEWITKRRPAKDMCAEMGVCRETLRRALRFHDIRLPVFTPEERRERYNAYQNRRYATDPKHRERSKACTLRWRKKNPERYREYQREYSRRKRAEAQQ